MQNFIVLANTDIDLMKFLFVGIWILVVFGIAISKMLGLNNKKNDAEPKGSSRNAGTSEDMARAKRRLQEMMRERQAQRGFFERTFEEVNSSPFEESYELESLNEPKPLEPSQQSLRTKPTSLQAEKPKANVGDEAYAQKSFDYNMHLEESQKLLAESEIAYNKATQKSKMRNTTETAEIGIDIKATEIRDFVHNKTLLKKSIIISEILDKPLSLR